MNPAITSHRTLISLLAFTVASLLTGAAAEPPLTIRLAVGPFFAPAANDELQKVGKVLPEMLSAELSHASRFRLVEREKVQALWTEFNLSAAGLVARDRVTKLGRVLACDWLVSGSLVQVGGKTLVWTKIIDVRDGVILDLSSTPYETSVTSNVAVRIAACLQQVGSQSRPKSRQFLAMGPFTDMNPPRRRKREDWSRRIATLIERHFLAAGYGVVELAAIGPIFEEHQMETAGLTGQAEQRVNLQTACWFVDGGCEWIEGEKLAVGIRVQQVAGQGQTLWLTNSPGPELESAVIATLSAALANTNLVLQPGPDAEVDLLAARISELGVGNSPFRPRRSYGQTVWESYRDARDQDKKRMELVNAAIANCERILIRNPNHYRAKLMLAHIWLRDPDPARRGRGKEMLREVADSKDVTFAPRALSILTNTAMLAMIEEVATRGRERPKDWKSLNQAYEEDPADLEVKCDLGAALLRLPRTHNREQGRQLLSEVAAGDRQDQAERARKLLAEPEKHPAVSDTPVKPPPGYLSPQDSDDMVWERRLGNEQPAISARREFLQKNFDKFVPVNFETDPDTELARIQRLPIKANMFDYAGRHYCGFRLVVPPWSDGDFTWMHILAKTEAQKDFSTDTFQWDIIPKSGKMFGFENPQMLEVEKYPELKRRFPYTHHLFCQYLPQRYWKPGQEYAIWFGFEESDLPDIAFALTISSNRGRREIGGLPVR
jgi:TolB-like protein